MHSRRCCSAVFNSHKRLRLGKGERNFAAVPNEHCNGTIVMPDSNLWYFAYGSNLSRRQMLERTGSIPSSRTAHLANYQLAFRKVCGRDEVYADIAPANGAIVHGVAYLCSSQAMAHLDLFEGVSEDCYRRVLVQVTTASGERLSAFAYIGGKAFSNEQGKPSKSYLNLILTGAREHQLPADYVTAIELHAI